MSFRAIGPRHQRGMVAMIIAIIVLVATLLATFALMRSVDTSNIIAGNMAFRQAAVQEAERAYEAVKANVPFSGTASESDATGLGYYASIQAATTRKDIPDLLTSSTATSCNGVAMPVQSNTDNSVCYVIERLCAQSGPADPNGLTNNCIIPAAVNTGGSASNQTSDRGLGLGGSVLAAYRLTVRVDGPKNTLSYVQTVMR